MQKIIQLEDRFPTGEPTVAVLGHWGHHRWYLEKQAFDKAAASPAYDYLKAYTPKEGYTIILVNALGAYETYDENKNGDGFPERAYRVGVPTPCGHPECNPNGGRLGWISEPETLIHHYRSFEEYGGIYQHHVNKDSTKSLGKILRSVWNDRMHRVELILEVKNERSPELVDRINAGEFPAVSMGCHVRWDVCTVCGHRAPTRAQYCQHAQFAMRAVDPRTGAKNAVLNPSPRFFDISIVYRPADPQGYMLKKVAEASYTISSAQLGEQVEAQAHKQAEVRKLSDIQKAITGQTMRVDSPEIRATKKMVPMLREIVRQGPKLGHVQLQLLLPHSLPTIFSTLAFKQAALSTHEVAQVIALKLANASPEQARVIRCHSQKIAEIQPVLFELFARYPSVEEKLGHLVEIAPKHVSQKLADDLSGWLKQRTLSPGGPLASTPWGQHYQTHEPAKSDVLTMTDPNTGQVYRTTRGAGMAANEQDQRSVLGGTALLSALYSAGLHKATRGKLPWQANMAMSLPAGFLSARKLFKDFNPYRNPQYLTDQGIPLSGGTEFVKSSTLLAKLIRDDLEQPVREPSFHKMAWLTHDCVQPPADAISEPTLDLYRFTQNLGALLRR